MDDETKAALVIISGIGVVVMLFMLGIGGNVLLEQYAKHTWPEKQCVEKVER